MQRGQYRCCDHEYEPVINDMTQENRIGVKNDACSCTFTQDELAQYAEEVQKRIDENNCEVFLNRSEWHAAIILRKFVESAKDTVNIFCGHLNKNVYGDLLPSFQEALKRGVRVRVMTAHPDVSAEQVAEKLRQLGAFRNFMKADDTIPHFAIVDGSRYRLETDDNEKTALVCAFAETREQVEQALSLDCLSDILWDSLEPKSV